VNSILDESRLSPTKLWRLNVFRIILLSHRTACISVNVYNSRVGIQPIRCISNQWQNHHVSLRIRRRNYYCYYLCYFAKTIVSLKKPSLLCLLYINADNIIASRLLRAAEKQACFTASILYNFLFTCYSPAVCLANMSGARRILSYCFELH